MLLLTYRLTELTLMQDAFPKLQRLLLSASLWNPARIKSSCGENHSLGVLKPRLGLSPISRHIPAETCRILVWDRLPVQVC